MPQKRSRYEKLARANGFSPADSVTASLSLLVAADPGENSSKLVKARKLGIPVQSLEEWLGSLKNGTDGGTALQADLFS